MPKLLVEFVPVASSVDMLLSCEAVYVYNNVIIVYVATPGEERAMAGVIIEHILLYTGRWYFVQYHSNIYYANVDR